MEPARLAFDVFSICMESSMTAIYGSAAAVTGAASGIGRALALELAARGCDLALADRDEAGLQAVAAEIGKTRTGARSRRIASMSASPAQIAGVCAGRHRRASRAQHRHQQCRRRAARPVQRDRPGADGLAVQHQFLGRGARHARLPAASFAAARGAYRQLLLDLRHHRARPARPPIARRNSRCAAFPKACGMSLRWRAARCRLSVVHPGGVATNIVRNSRTGVGVTDNARRARIDRALRGDAPRPRRRPPRCASSRASRRTSRAS